MSAFRFQRCPPTLLAAALGCALLGSGAAAQDAGIGKVLFTTGDVPIVTPDGTARPAVRGAVIAPGERLVTGGSGLGQVKMDDGGLVSLRPDSGLVFEPTADTSTVMTLDSGDVRVLNLPATEAARPGAYVLRTPDGQVQMTRADVVAAAPDRNAPSASRGSLFQLNRGAGVAEARGGAQQALSLDRPVAVSRTAGIKLADRAASDRLASIKVPVGASLTAKDPAQAGSPFSDRTAAGLNRQPVPLALQRPAGIEPGPFKGLAVAPQLKRGGAAPPVVRPDEAQTVRRLTAAPSIAKLPPLIFAARKGAGPTLRFSSTDASNAGRASTILRGVTRGGTTTKGTFTVVPTDSGSRTFTLQRRKP